MVNRFAVKPVFVYGLVWLLIVNGCNIQIGDRYKTKHKRVENLSAPIAEAAMLNVRTDVGSIVIIGADVADCNVIATITAMAKTVQEAEELAQKVKIRLQPSAERLDVIVEKPPMSKKSCIKVNFKITVPRQMNLDCSADVGGINITGIAGRIAASTDVGNIVCRDVSSQLDLEVDVGNVNVKLAEAVAGQCDVKITTDVGNINFAAPADLSAQLNASTDVGSIKTNLPVEIKGQILQKRVQGTIGTGQGRLHLKTDVGSIRITQTK